ncbi:MAG TPA: hypothetical protein VMX54_13195 [Vicinamibacteria bacterium]|nr:hypothetical protein [Vicinamibacteria bacterium]
MRRHPGLGWALLALAATASVAPAGTATRADRADSRPLPFLSDDYGRALADARARSLPLFIEAWAPW